MKHLTIGDVARQTGLQTSAIRYYESEGLLLEPERISGQRRYDESVLTRLTLIGMAQEAGLTIAEIRTLLSGYPESTTAGDRWREIATQKLPEVEVRIERLQAMRSVLLESLACDCLTLDACASLGWPHNRPDGS